ncbi:MAG: MCE family protein [Bacteroidetes bacterium]|nr:MCE family protein [Bacteroidota bacterium]
MIKISNETKIGILAVVALAGLILGFNFLKGSSLFQHTKKLYATFDNVQGVEVSNPLQINGLTIGTVTSINEADQDLAHGVVLTITLKKDIHIPDDSYAQINTSFLGTAAIVIQKGVSTKFLDNGDTLLTRKKPDLISQVQESVNPVLTKLGGTLTSLDSLIQKVNTMFDPRLKNNFSAIIANLAASTAQLQVMLNTQTGELAQSLKHVNAFTDNLAKNNDHITHTLDNVEKTTAHLAEAKLPETIESLRGAINQMQTLVGKLNSNNGSLGMLMNDKKLYQNLESSTRSLNILLDDFRVHPKRYVNVSVFGRKDKSGPLTAPLSDSTAAPQPKK